MTPELHIEQAEELFGPVYWVKETPWLVRNRILSPLFLPHALPEFKEDDMKEALDQSGALMAWWVDQWDRNRGEWYWICCDDSTYSEDSVRNSRYRKLVRKGGRLGTVSKINTQEHGRAIYDLIAKAIDQYDDSKTDLESYDSFQETLNLKSNSGHYEFWAYFCEDRLLSYCECLLINDAIRLVSGKSDYEFRKLNPNNALFYQVTEHYLTERGFSYVTNGQKTIHHPSKVNVLFENLGYRKIFCRPRLAYSAKVKPVAKGMSNPFGRSIVQSLPLGKAMASKIKSFQAIIDIEKANRA